MADFRESLIQALPDLRAFARGLVGRRDVADDLVAACLRDILQNTPDHMTQSDPQLCLFRTLYWRFLRGHAGHSGAAMGAEDDDPEMADVAMARLSAALSELPHEWRAAVILTGMHGFSNRRAARILELPVTTVRAHNRRGHAQLKAILFGDVMAHVRRLGLLKGWTTPSGGKGG